MCDEKSGTALAVPARTRYAAPALYHEQRQLCRSWKFSRTPETACENDTPMKIHIEKVTRMSKEWHVNAGGSKGRGGLITLMSKSTVNHIIDIIGELIKVQYPKK